MTMITPSYLGETIEYSSLHACRSTLEDPTGFPVGPAVRRSLGLASSTVEVAALLDGLDPDLRLPAGALRIARGHTHGPRPVHLPAGWLESIDDPTPPAGGDILVSGG